MGRIIQGIILVPAIIGLIVLAHPSLDQWSAGGSGESFWTADRRLFVGLAAVILTVVAWALIIPAIFGFEVVEPGNQDMKEIGRGTKRRCPHCDLAIPLDAHTCPECGQRLYPPLHPITHDKIAALLQQIDKQSLSSPPEEYLSNAQEHAWNRQVKEAAVELGKVLLTSPPKSEIHAKAKGLLKKMGYRF